MVVLAGLGREVVWLKNHIIWSHSDTCGGYNINCTAFSKILYLSISASSKKISQLNTAQLRLNSYPSWNLIWSNTAVLWQCSNSSSCSSNHFSGMILVPIEWGSMSREWHPKLGWGVPSMMRSKCIMTNGHMGYPLWTEWLTNGQTQMKTLPSHNLLCM